MTDCVVVFRSASPGFFPVCSPNRVNIAPSRRADSVTLVSHQPPTIGVAVSPCQHACCTGPPQLLLSGSCLTRPPHPCERQLPPSPHVRIVAESLRQPPLAGSGRSAPTNSFYP